MAKVKLTEIANKLGKSATDLARETGINRNTINALMKGHVEDVKFSTLEKLCKTYHLQISDLLEESVSSPAPSTVPEQKPDRKLYKQEAECVPFTGWTFIPMTKSDQFDQNDIAQIFGKINLYFKNNYTLIYWDFHALKNLANSFFQFYSDKEKYKKFYYKYLMPASSIEDIYFEMQKRSPETLNRSSVQSIFEKLRGVYVEFWKHSLFIDAFDTGVDQDIIQQIATTHHLDIKEIEILTTPIEMTFADERKFALLSLIKNVIGSNSVTNQKLKILLEKNRQVIDTYRVKFDYYKSNYLDIKHISEEETEEEIQKYLNDGKLFKEEYERLDGYTKKKTTEIEAVLKKYKLKENPLWFFNSITYWREHRKKINLMGIHVLDFILSVIEEQTGIQKKYLRYLSFDEVDNVLKGLIPSSALEWRCNEGMLVSIEDGAYKIFEGNEASAIKNELETILLGDEKSEVTVLSGRTASQGYAKGIARIILTQDDFDQFQEGEILVTSMTRPEFVPLMKKAVAIVTNEGGITCHAAIVSRELGKPCVIGTKNATQLIKNGDLIEVRANHGTVRIFK